RQADEATNLSSATPFRWIKETQIPPTPTIASPSLNPHYSNDSSLTISGSCIDGYSVQIKDESFEDSTTCSSSSFSFIVNASSDGNYQYNITQNDGITDSGAANVNWIYDSVAPDAPTINSPLQQPYYSASGL